MNAIALTVFLVSSPALAILSGCWGIEMIDENPLTGWVLLTIGVIYPPGAIVYNRYHHKHIHHP